MTNVEKLQFRGNFPWGFSKMIHFESNHSNFLFCGTHFYIYRSATGEHRFFCVFFFGCSFVALNSLLYANVLRDGFFLVVQIVAKLIEYLIS